MQLAPLAGAPYNFGHTQAQRLGREKWYASYMVRVARVEYEYAFSAAE
jgi:hypothetical protein